MSGPSSELVAMVETGRIESFGWPGAVLSEYAFWCMGGCGSGWLWVPVRKFGA